jgi:hypothetical protein
MEKLALIGSTDEMVVSSVVGLTRLPISMLATPSMSDFTLVNPRLSSACSTAALAA